MTTHIEAMRLADDLWKAQDALAKLGADKTGEGS